MEVGLDYQVGIGAARLSAAQRQKLAISRVLLKRPDVVVVDNATASLDGGAQDRIKQNLLNLGPETSLIWVVPHAKVAEGFDAILVLEGGKVVEQGHFDTLSQPGTKFSELLDAD